MALQCPVRDVDRLEKGANPSWPNDWMLVLSLLHRYSSYAAFCMPPVMLYA